MLIKIHHDTEETETECVVVMRGLVNAIKTEGFLPAGNVNSFINLLRNYENRISLLYIETQVYLKGHLQKASIMRRGWM